MKIEFTIPIAPVTKKNHSQIVKLSNGRTVVIPSKQYTKYEKDAKAYMPKCNTIDRMVNVKAIYYMPTRRRCDITNLSQALLDVMVKYKVLEDDNYSIVWSMDGSRVYYDKENPRTEVEITEVKL